MEDRLKKREEEIYNQDEGKRMEEEERRWTEETLRKLAEVQRMKEEGRLARTEKKEMKNVPGDEKSAENTVIEVLISRDGYKLIN